MSYDREIVAKVKGLMLAGLTVKAAARISGIPYVTVREWRAGTRQRGIEADQTIKQTIERYMQGPERKCGTLLRGGGQTATGTHPAASDSDTEQPA